VLAPGGRLAIRTPTAEFVRLAHDRATTDALRASAANHAVLGVPFARCLSRRALLDMLVEHGFEVETVRGRRRGWAPPRAPAPWVDVVARRLEEGKRDEEIRYDQGIPG